MNMVMTRGLCTGVVLTFVQQSAELVFAKHSGYDRSYMFIEELSHVDWQLMGETLQ